MSRRDNLDLLVVALLSLLAAAMAVLAAPVPLRLPIGMVAALVLPGYSVSMALFPPGDLDRIERSGLAFTLSLGVIVVIAPILNLSPAGLSPDAVVVGVTTVTVVASAIAWLRRRVRPAGGPLFGIELPGRQWLRAPLRPWMAAALGLVGVLFVALLANGVAAQSRNATEFFLVGSGGNPDGLPARVTSGTPSSIAVGITNSEDSAQPFRIVVESGAGRLGETGPIAIGAGQTWTGAVDFTIPNPGRDQDIRILLFTGSSTEPYRSLKLNVEAFAPA